MSLKFPDEPAELGFQGFKCLIKEMFVNNVIIMA